MSKLAALKSADSLTALAAVLGVKAASLSYVLYKIPDNRKYTAFQVAKRSGGSRTIEAPLKRLKFIQHKLHLLLAQCEVEIRERRGIKEDCRISHGFTKGRSILTNAEVHRNRRYVFNVDLAEFFPSITFGRVWGFFQKNDDFKLDRRVATVIAQIACYKNRLPQGSPCSPIMANMIAGPLDIQLSRLAEMQRCSYSRYADDITFSTDMKTFPEAIARRINVETWEAGDEVLRLVFRNGFRLNRQKIRMQYESSRQTVTGVVVNKRINPPYERYKLARALCHRLFGGRECFEMNGREIITMPRAAVSGAMSYLHQLSQFETVRIQQGGDKRSLRFDALYKKYLDYTKLYDPHAPMILTEGKTDILYIRSAIEAIGAAYPRLWDIPKGQRQVKIFTYSRTSASVQSLGGGAGDLTKLINHYGERTKDFRVASKTPLIVVVDNDEGAKPIFTRYKIDGTKPYYHIQKNLYVVPVPHVGGKPVAIEALFTAALLASKHKGKDLDLTGKQTDSSKWYSKNTFAVEVVRSQRRSVDFSGFAPLLKGISEAIEDYEKKVSGVV